jgi:hypothetical protein
MLGLGRTAMVEQAALRADGGRAHRQAPESAVDMAIKNNVSISTIRRNLR